MPTCPPPYTPSPTFEDFAHEAVASEIQRQGLPVDTVIRHLWASAQYDCYTQHGVLRPMLDDSGRPYPEMAAYGILIAQAVARLRPPRANLRLVRSSRPATLGVAASS
jgi:hypothetical protein